MPHLAMALSMLIALTLQEPPRPSPADRSAYEADRARAGHDPAKLVKLALWCELRGMNAERRAALEEAVRLDPNNKAAHGLLNQVLHQGRWESPEAVRERIRQDEALTAKLAEYNARRERIDRDTETERRAVAALEQAGNQAKADELRLALDRRIAPEHVRLGLWCEKNGLKPEAMAHFTTALQLNPHDQATWRHLGYVPHHGRWMSHEQIAEEQREALAQKHADHHWELLLHRLEIALRDRHRRAGAEEELAKVSDPRAIPSIVRAFGAAGAAGQRMIVRLLGQIDAPGSSRRLAALAVFGDTPAVREGAAGNLKGREPRDYAEWLVNLIRTPVTYRVQPVGGPGTEGTLEIDSPRYHVLRKYDAPPAFKLSSTFRGYIGYDLNGLPVVMTGIDLRHYQEATAVSNPKDLNFGKIEGVLRAAEARMRRCWPTPRSSRPSHASGWPRTSASWRNRTPSRARSIRGPRASCGWPWTPRPTSPKTPRMPGNPGSTSGLATATSRR